MAELPAADSFQYALRNVADDGVKSPAGDRRAWP
jgi:hypothetical protein